MKRARALRITFERTWLCCLACADACGYPRRAGLVPSDGSQPDKRLIQLKYGAPTPT